MANAEDRDELKAKLNRVQAEDLVELVLAMLKEEPGLDVLVQSWLIEKGDDGPDVDLDGLRKQAAYAIEAVGWDYHAMQRAAPLLEPLVGVAEGLLGRKRYSEAAGAAEAIIDGVLDAEYANRREDRGAVSSVLDTCFELMAECLQPDNLDHALRERIVRRLHTGYELGMNRNMDWMSEVCAGLALKKLPPAEKELFATLLEDEGGTLSGAEKESRTREHAHLLIRLRADVLDDEAYLAFGRKYGLGRLVIAKLLDLNRVEEAIKEAGSDVDPRWLAGLLESHAHPEEARRIVLRAVDGRHSREALVWLIERARRDGDRAAELEFSLRLFPQRRTPRDYEEIKRVAKGLGVWERHRPGILAVMSDRRSAPPDRVEVYLAEHMIEEALLDVEKHAARCGDDIALKVARAAEEEFPADAVRLYRRLVKAWVPASTRYDAAAECMARMAKLYARIGQSDEWLRFRSRMAEEHKRRYKFIAELRKRGLT